jgi:hypothetical protein
LEQECRKHQYHKTHIALEDWSKKVKGDTIAKQKYIYKKLEQEGKECSYCKVIEDGIKK